MRKDRIVLDRETYENILALPMNNADHWYREYMKYSGLYCSEKADNKKLQNENGYLRALFDKEGDTNVIKYNGKLYRIVSTSHFHDECEVDTLDINAVRVDEVSK